MTESKNIYNKEKPSNQDLNRCQKIIQTKQNWSEEQKLYNRSKCSYGKYLTWCIKKNKTPEYQTFEEYEEIVCKPLYQEEKIVNLLENNLLDLKSWLSTDTNLKIRKINANKLYANIKQKIIDITSFYENIQLKERIYCILNDITEKKLCKCGCNGYVSKPSVDFIEYHSNKNEDIKKIKKENYKFKTGYDNPSQNPDVKKKKEETCLKHFGETNQMKSKKIVEEFSKKYFAKTGYNNPFQVPENKKKARETSKTKYGCEWYTQTDEYINRWKNYNNIKYGTDYYTQTEDFKRKVKEIYVNMDEDDKNKIISKRIDTNVEKYGFKYFSQSEDFKGKYKNYEFVQKMLEKSYQTKRKNNSFNKSNIEDEIYNILVTKFENVKRQYKSVEYPFMCDFYISELDLYIEFQGTWTHGGKPFDKINDLHKMQLNEWKEKSSKSEFYKNAIKVWTITDPLKRKIAKEHNLNWIEFFSMEEFMKWFESI